MLNLPAKIAKPPIREQDPLKQGLKPRIAWIVSATTHIREQDPLKQGLKPTIATIASSTCDIREQDPLKQGLKPSLINCNRSGVCDS